MAIIILAFALVVGIAFFQVIQGLFSSLIMAILTILCAAVAFNYYEPLAALFMYQNQPAYSEAAALIALFVLPLLGLRILFDRLVPGNVVMGQWADRIGGGALGLVTGIVLVGVLATVVQMLPLKESLLTYRSHNDALQRDQRLAPFYPDEFTIGLVRGMSNLALHGGTDFSQSHDDLLLEQFCARNTAGTYGRVDALPDSLRVVAAYSPQPVPDWLDPPRNLLIDRSELQKTVVVRVAVSEEARNEKDNRWRLPGTHFRMVCETGRSYYPLAYLIYNTENTPQPQWETMRPPDEEGDFQQANLLVARQWAREKGPKELQVDWVYRIPLKEKPQYLVFRRVAKQPIPKIVKGEPPTKGALGKQAPPPRRRRRRR